MTKQIFDKSQEKNQKINLEATTVPVFVMQANVIMKESNVKKKMHNIKFE